MKIAEKITEFAQIGETINAEDVYESWLTRVATYLTASLGRTFADDLITLTSPTWYRRLQMQLGHLEGLAAKFESEEANGQCTQQEVNVATKSSVCQRTDISRVFIVHGHDGEAKEGLARFLEKLGLEPVILHEKPNSGYTIIEKFEVYSDVGFAVILLTPDDVGALATSASKLAGRARQNVILELGYFLGKLGRDRVCALYRDGVELPSDYQGVLYVEIDNAGAWKTKLAQELIQAKFSINISALVAT